jgi:hypothetical protein
VFLEFLVFLPLIDRRRRLACGPELVLMNLDCRFAFLASFKQLLERKSRNTWKPRNARLMLERARLVVFLVFLVFLVFFR